MVYLGFFIAALVLVAAVILLVACLPEPDPKNTTPGAMADLNEISARVMEVRKRILHSQLHDAERLAMADELLFISDDVKEAAGRLLANATANASFMRQPGGGFS